VGLALVLPPLLFLIALVYLAAVTFSKVVDSLGHQQRRDTVESFAAAPR